MASRKIQKKQGKPPAKPRKRVVKPSEKHKLAAWHKSIMLQLLAEFLSPMEIQHYFKRELDMEIHHTLPTYYAKKYADEILMLRAQFMKKLGEIPISHKHWRLKELNRLYKDVTREERLWLRIPKTVKTRVIEESNGVTTKDEVVDYETVILKGNHNVAGQILRLARDEMEQIQLESGLKPVLEGSRKVKLWYVMTGDTISEQQAKTIPDSRTLFKQLTQEVKNAAPKG